MDDPKVIHAKILSHNVRLYTVEQQLTHLVVSIKGAQSPTTTVSPEAVVPEESSADKILPRLDHQDDLIKRMEIAVRRLGEGNG